MKESEELVVEEARLSPTEIQARANANLQVVLGLPEVAALARPGEALMGGKYRAGENEYLLQFWPLLINNARAYYGEGYAITGPVVYIIDTTQVADLPYADPRHEHFSRVVHAKEQMGQQYSQGSGGALCRGDGGDFVPDPISCSILLRTWHLQVHTNSPMVSSSAQGWWARNAEAFFASYPRPDFIHIPSGDEGRERLAKVYPLGRELVERYVRGEATKYWKAPR